MKSLETYLTANFFVDSDHSTVRDFAHAHTAADATPKKNSVQLYYAIRDGFRYNPWRVKVERGEYKASGVLERDLSEGAHCIDKANLLAACCRVIGVPSRLHFATVRNHIGSAEIEKVLGTDLLVFHGYAELFLAERWVAATPAFNKELCEHLNVDPLEFDGENDSVFQQYDRNGGQFMEYTHDYGTYPDVPFDLMLAEWRKHYPFFRQNGQWMKQA
ncbi:MAG: transglutaminase [Deltaproteobacteria bacterium RIFOXYB12_FULL_58_9]|nr:MAG: transglutaminase [Deltaproteobacteria bacterium RIFOXYB12_FULL_58_9]